MVGGCKLSAAKGAFARIRKAGNMRFLCSYCHIMKYETHVVFSLSGIYSRRGEIKALDFRLFNALLLPSV